MLPKAANIAVLWNPDYSSYLADWRELRASAKAKGMALQSKEIRSPADLEGAFATFNRERPDAVFTLSDTLTFVLAKRVASLATETKLPIITPFREVTEAGGLMSYGPNVPAMFGHAADYVVKILKGASPADLPVEQPTNFEMLINLNTAKMLGIEVTPQLLAGADEVIE